MDSQEIQALIDRDNLGRVAAARYEAESFLQMHSKDYFATPQNGKLISEYVQQNGLGLTAEGFEEAYVALQKSGKLLPAREAIARMSADEVKAFAAENGTPVYDGFGRVMGHNFPEAYSQPTPADYNRPHQSSTLSPVADPYPEDKGKKFTARQLASFSSDRFKAYAQRTGQWGK
jgi:hypothetical protein